MSFFSRTVELTDKDTNYTLKQLMQTVLDTDGDGYQAPIAVAELNVLADDANADAVVVGDPTHLTVTDYGLKLAAGDSDRHGAGNMAGGISTNARAYRSASDAQKLHIDARLI